LASTLWGWAINLLAWTHWQSRRPEGSSNGLPAYVQLFPFGKGGKKGFAWSKQAGASAQAGRL